MTTTNTEGLEAGSPSTDNGTSSPSDSELSTIDNDVELDLASEFYRKYPDTWVTEPDGYVHRVAHPEAVFKARINAIGVPPTYRECSFDTFRTPTQQHATLCGHVLDWCVKAKDTPVFSGLLIVGATGTGKTHLAVACCKELIRQGFYSPNYIYWREVAEELRTAHPAQYYSEPNPMVIDDMGEISCQKYVMERMQLVLIKRMENNFPTIITSNLKWPDQWMDVGLVDDRLVSRFAESYDIVSAQGISDRRFDIRQEKKDHDQARGEAFNQKSGVPVPDNVMEQLRIEG